MHHHLMLQMLQVFMNKKINIVFGILHCVNDCLHLRERICEFKIQKHERTQKILRIKYGNESNI